MKNIVLTGFMASGKTTIGKCVAEKLGMSFIDTDELIEQQQKMSTNEIFEKYGEPYFRELENKCAKELASVSGTVIATGGGFVLNSENIYELRKNGIIFNLKTNPEIIKDRLDGARGTRPLLRGDEMSGILKRFSDRGEFYANCDEVIELFLEGQPEQYANVIIKKYLVRIGNVRIRASQGKLEKQKEQKEGEKQMQPKFGPAGNGELFLKSGFKASEDMPKFLADYGLDAYEYQCGNGVRVGEEKARLIGERAKEHGIAISLHSPYYINLATPDEQKRANNISYILQSMQAVKQMGGNRVVVHSGALQKMTREEALENAKECVKIAIKEIDSAGFGDIHMCIETMGKINQLGNLDEVMELCKIDDRLLPTIDFGHLNARTLGGLNDYDSFLAVFDAVENNLGSDRLKIFHSHFSHIEYTKGGEKKHLTFEDNEFGPNFDFAAEIIYKKNLSPVIICESAGTQIEDALSMKKAVMNFGEIEK